MLITALAKASWEFHPLWDLPQTAQFDEEFKTEVSLSPLPVVAGRSESQSEDCAWHTAYIFAMQQRKRIISTGIQLSSSIEQSYSTTNNNSCQPLFFELYSTAKML